MTKQGPLFNPTSPFLSYLQHFLKALKSNRDSSSVLKFDADRTIESTLGFYSS